MREEGGRAREGEEEGREGGRGKGEGMKEKEKHTCTMQLWRIRGSKGEGRKV